MMLLLAVLRVYELHEQSNSKMLLSFDENAPSDI